MALRILGGPLCPPTTTPRAIEGKRVGAKPGPLLITPRLALAPSAVPPTSRVAWGGGSCRSLTLRRLILMAWRKSGGRRWGWERCVAMVVGSALHSATPWLPPGGNKEAAG